MLQFQILSGKSAGGFWDARRFPVHIGRAVGNDLQLADDGVWNEHFQVTLNPAEGFVLSVHPGALVTINQTPVSTARLHPGDLIAAGPRGFASGSAKPASADCASGNGLCGRWCSV